MIPYFALTLIYMVIGHNTMKNNSYSTNLTVSFCCDSIWSLLLTSIFYVQFLASIFGAVSLSIASLTLSPPSRFPHIHVLLNCLYSFAHFALFLAYFVHQQYLSYCDKSTSISFTNIRTKIKRKWGGISKPPPQISLLFLLCLYFWYIKFFTYIDW